MNKQFAQFMRLDHPLNVNLKYNLFFTIVPNQFVGLGIKKTNAYNSRLSRSEWTLKRQEFWETRIEGKAQCWQAIKEACEKDEKMGIDILAATELKLVNKSIQIAYDIQGHKYDVPVFCINEPLQFPINNSTEAGLVQQFNGMNIQIIIRCTKFPKDYIASMMTSQTIADLKANILSTYSQFSKIRLIFNGRELSDHHQIGQYNIQDKSVLKKLIKYILGNTGTLHRKCLK